MMARKYFPTFTAIGRWMGFGLLVLFVLLAIPWTYFNIKWGRELEAKLAALKAEGMPLTFAEAAPQPVPDDQNAAVVYQEVFRVHFHYPPADGMHHEPLAGLSNEEQVLLHEYLEQPDAQREQRIRALLASPRVQEALEVFRRGVQRPHCVFAVNWQDGAAALFPHMSRFRSASEIIAAHALVLAKDGHLDEALDWCQVALRMSEHAASEPTLIAQLVVIAMRIITLDVVEQIVSATGISPATAARFEESLREIDLHEGFTAAMITERASGQWVFDILSENRHEFYKFLSYPSTPYGTHLALRLYASWLARPLQKLDRLAHLEYMGRQIELTELPYREAESEYEAWEGGVSSLPFYFVVTRIVFPVFSRATQKRDYAVAKIGLCRVALALKVYKYERDAYPDTLEQLQQTLAGELPADPFSGKNFVYRRQGEGFKIYSLGQDFDDDDGRPVEEAKGRLIDQAKRFGVAGPDSRRRWDDHDIVWECAR